MQISVQCMRVNNLLAQTLLCNKTYLMNFTRWNYNSAFYYFYLIMEKMYKINKSNILHRKNGLFASFIAKRDATKQIFRGNVKETATVCCC
jgi:hypothetical protein